MLKRIREARGMTQDALARKAKISKPYISQIENGIRKSPSLPVLRRLAKALGVPVTELLQ
jgi:XRE family transcriptional regulator of biofilm formation